MTTKCPKCGTIVEAEEEVKFMVGGGRGFVKPRMTTFCTDCKTEFNIKMNSIEE